MIRSMILTMALILAGPALAADRAPAPMGAAVYFITPADGETVTSPVTVRFGLEGMGVAPAGIDKPNTGHHHLLIDAPDLPPLDEPIPADGETLADPITVRFGLKGMGVAPAGIDKANTGHHPLLIDTPDLPPLDEPIPADDHHKHFGGGQTETTIDLPPGTHTLQLLLADQNHTAFDPPIISKRITITVQ